jgi:hypothetical protein
MRNRPCTRPPHTATCVMDDWTGAYSRKQAVFPVPGLELTKYFPPVRRIDGAYGDRNLVCSCPPPEAFAVDLPETASATETATEGKAMSQTALYNVHKQLGAAFTDFGGWDMPLKYGSELAEHRAVRQTAGLFDLSHMGEVRVSGPDAAAYLDYALLARYTPMEVGRAKYGVILDAAGHTIDDLITYRLADDEFLVVPNAREHRRGLRRHERTHRRLRGDGGRRIGPDLARCGAGARRRGDPAGALDAG